MVPNQNGPLVGVDAGATLAKLVLLDPSGAHRTEILPSRHLDAVARRVAESGPARVGLTGGGAAELARALGDTARTVNEFSAWGAGAGSLLRQRHHPVPDRFLLVSLGTGTSVMHVDPHGVQRVGGTALGGGTVVGLGAALLGTGDFHRLAALAARGDRRRVDLLVSDIYRAGEFPLGGDLTAASFGRLARSERERPDPEHLAHALMGLVGENVALICCGLAAATGSSTVVYAGSTLRGNPALREILEAVTRALGPTPLFLEEGEFVGAHGALIRAAEGG